MRRFPRIELAAEPEFSECMTLRGLRELRVDLGTRPANRSEGER